MKILFDTANLAVLEEMVPLYPLAGVTTNPTILTKEGRIDVYKHLRQIRRLIGPDRSLHIQVLASGADAMVEEAHRMIEQVDDQVFVKVPTTEQGLRAIRLLKDEGVRVTATAIYSKVQGMLAIAAGADYLAPYFNRMESQGADARATVSSLAQFAERHGTDCAVMVASFKNVAQVSDAFDSGATAVTVPPALLREALTAPAVTQAVAAFTQDWSQVFGTTTLP